MSFQNIEPIAITSENTVVAELDSKASKAKAYESESELEAAFIELLQDQAYEYLPVTDETALMANLKIQIEKLNKVEFSDTEWERFFTESISSEKDGIIEKTRRFQEDHIRVLKRDNGESKNIYLIDKQHIHNNSVQVLNQYEVEGARKNRYDVTILVNGLPLVHIELKRRGVDIREAFNQINRYQQDSFWAGCGLFQYVQIFVISNGTYTKYYSNTVRDQHIKEASGNTRIKKTSNSYEFTSWWADANNKPIYDLMSFGKTFFAKHSLLNILTKYCVFTSDQMLLTMRPYQIVATERVLQKIVMSENQKTLGTIDAGGYVWHTTGSGKTLTSFKTAQIASKMPSVDKVLFVVDRKDLDYQTMKEYNRFQEGAANASNSTKQLQERLEDPSAKIIITTIQKLSKFIALNPNHSVHNKRVVLIFDECHRSQFGDMHVSIKKAFSNYNLFGFTGTPIFAANSSSGNNPSLRTTEQAFGVKLHTYTIVDAITDKNVLPFRVDYVNTIKMPELLVDREVSAIDTEKALMAPERITKIAQYILEHFDQKTRRNDTYTLKNKRVSGFNSLMATASIDAAKRYYATFKELQKDMPVELRLKIGIIYSYAPNEDEVDGLLPDEEFEASNLDASSRDFLEVAIKDYNTIYSTNFDTSSEGFSGYYANLSEKLKKREIDLVIVVNMFLTGFDSTTLNTLWVDKNLRLHGLLQAFSRTNRILNSVKTYGNIVCFRDLEQATNDSISLFGNKDAGGIVILKPFREYYDEYSNLVSELTSKFGPGELPASETDQREFVNLYNKVLRLQNILKSFDDFKGNELLPERSFQDYQSTYIEIYQALTKGRDGDKESIIQDLIFEIELVKQVEINVDFILILIRGLQGASASENKEIKAKINKTVLSSFSLRSKRDLIERFIETVNNDSDVEGQWKKFVDEAKAEELGKIIADENLNPTETTEFINKAFADGELKSAGTAVTKLLPAKNMFSPSYEHSLQKSMVIEKLKAFFDRFSNL
jgi:type I restriction enzyme, R subunit